MLLVRQGHANTLPAWALNLLMSLMSKRWRSISTIGGAGDTTIPFPGRSPKHPLSGIGLRDPCPESNFFHQGVGQ